MIRRPGATGVSGIGQVERPVVPGGTQTFLLRFVRATPRSSDPALPPILVIPGGPGIGSILPYRALRRYFAAAGLAVIMVEHRGVGSSRKDRRRRDLPPEAITITQVVDDLAAVLDTCGIERAVVFGSSYGTYLAEVFGVRHPGRVAGMVLDSPLLGSTDPVSVRDTMRRLFWDAGEPRTLAASESLRYLVETGGISAASSGVVVQSAIEFGGIGLLERLLGAMTDGTGRRTWNAIAAVRLGEGLRGVRFFTEFALVGRIAFRELGFHPPRDGIPMDPSSAYDAVATRFPAFEAEPYDLVAELPRFHWPTVVVSGERDLTTPPAIARRIHSLIPGSVLVSLAATGHSALDTRQAVARHVAAAVQRGRQGALVDEAAQIDALPRTGITRHLGPLIDIALVAERRLDGALAAAAPAREEAMTVLARRMPALIRTRPAPWSLTIRRRPATVIRGWRDAAVRMAGWAAFPRTHR